MRPLLDQSQQTAGENIFIAGDNLAGIELVRRMGVTADLVYIDPPYATNREFLIDTNRANSVSASGTTAYQDRTTGERYVSELMLRIQALHDVMAEHASIFVHINVQNEHHVRLMLDEVFGPENYQTTVARIKCNPKNFRRAGYGNIRDSIVHYSKRPEAFLHRPGRATMNAHEAKLVGIPLAEARLMPPQDVWVFKDPQRPQYPTEKNSAMLRRIIETCSDPGHTVLDCYAGSGTTLVEAARLGRRFIGIDQSPAAERVIRKRLEKTAVKFRRPRTMTRTP